MFVCDSFFNFFEFLHENKSGKFQREQTVLISLSQREIKMSFAIHRQCDPDGLIICQYFAIYSNENWSSCIEIVPKWVSKFSEASKIVKDLNSCQCVKILPNPVTLVSPQNATFMFALEKRVYR